MITINFVVVHYLMRARLHAQGLKVLACCTSDSNFDIASPISGIACEEGTVVVGRVIYMLYP
jgi:hypothetical protein